MFFPWPPSTNIVIGHFHWLYCNFTTRPGASRQQSVSSLCYWEEEMMFEGFAERDLLFSVVFIPLRDFSLAWQNEPARNLCILSHFLKSLPLFLKFYHVSFLQFHWCPLKEVFILLSNDILQLPLLPLFSWRAKPTLRTVFPFLFPFIFILNGGCGSFKTVFLKITVCNGYSMSTFIRPTGLGFPCILSYLHYLVHFPCLYLLKLNLQLFPL